MGPSEKLGPIFIINCNLSVRQHHKFGRGRRLRRPVRQNIFSLLCHCKKTPVYSHFVCENARGFSGRRGRRPLPMFGERRKFVDNCKFEMRKIVIYWHSVRCRASPTPINQNLKRCIKIFECFNKLG